MIDKVTAKGVKLKYTGLPSETTSTETVVKTKDFILE
jgi:hypothetical protein